MSQKPKISVAVISRDESSIIGKMLESISYLKDDRTEVEIVVLDSGSEDDTIEIAKKYGASIFQESWKGFTEQKNSLFEKCSGEWILNLDCDEVLTTELGFEIKIAIHADKYSGFRINRKTYYLGKLMNYAWQPDRRLRLVRSDADPKWDGGSVHESLTCSGEVRDLDNHMIHYSYSSLHDHFTRLVKYAELSALDAFNHGERSNFFKMLISSWNAFIKIYIFKRGFLDGYRGYIAAFSNQVKTAIKHFILWDKS